VSAAGALLDLIRKDVRSKSTGWNARISLVP
jgi:hypothetical protein